MKLFQIINYNSLIICVLLVLISIFLFTFLYRSKFLIFISLSLLIVTIAFVSYTKLNKITDSPYDYISVELNKYDNTIVYLYSNYWAACTAYKPLVKQLSISINNYPINFIQYEISTYEGNDFIERYNYKSVPSMFLLNNKGTIINRWNRVPQLNELLKFINN